MSEAQREAQQGWFWSVRGGLIHLPGPAAGWSLCGTARLSSPANRLWKHPWKRFRIGHKCAACLRLRDGS